MVENADEAELWTETKLKREEIRGVFVIGLIAAFLSIRSIIPLDQDYAQVFVNVTNFLIAFWVLYLFLIAISLSDDIKLPSKENEEQWMKKESFSTTKTIAHFIFIIGILMSTAYISLIFLVFAIGVALIAALILAIIAPFILFYRFIRWSLTNLYSKIQRT